MRVIRCPSSAISKGLSRRGSRCWTTSVCQEQWQQRATQMTQCWWGLSAGGSEGWRLVVRTGGGQKGTLCPGEDWRMWGFGPCTEELVSWDWTGGLEGTGLRWAGLALPSMNTHTRTHTHTHTHLPAWHSARPFCGSNALKLQTPPHPQWAAMDSLQSSASPPPEELVKIRVVISKHKNQDDNEPKRKMLILL